MRRKSKVEIETEEYIDNHIKEWGWPPTYRQVQDHFGLKSANSAYYRCKRFRHKMEKKRGEGLKEVLMRINESQKKLGIQTLPKWAINVINSYNEDQKTINNSITVGEMAA